MEDLHSVITPSLLRQMHQARIPWARTQSITGKAIINEFFSDAMRFKEAVKPAWPVLKAISEAYGPDKVPDMMPFLSSPEDPDFPEQAFGMHVLIDQAPRVLFRDIDQRWTSWFDKAARKLYEGLYGLDKSLRPWRRERWVDASFDYWACVALQFNATMAHQESVRSQEVCEDYVEELRRAVEHHTGHRDPARDQPRLDEYSFVKLVTSVDRDYEWAFHEAAFFFYNVFDAHKPIIDRFGRYPYRNAVEGRISTELELEWLEKTDHFAEVAPDVARRVKEDIVAGRWTPLGKGEDTLLDIVIRLEDGRI